MCGIFGFAAWDREMPRVGDLCRVTNLLRHRGPDGGGYWHERGVFFGHRRLSIIDIAGGHQPMATADGRYVITFNGEIYNYPELRDELREAGATFLTASDTEVILAGYAVWGVDVISRLEGMFACALYDRFDQTLLLARDRFGEKPLLVSEGHGRVAFASELAPLVAAGVGGREIDIEALGGYLCLNYVPGTRTMLRDVGRVAPAEWRLYGRDGLRAQARYWSPADTPAPGPPDGGPHVRRASSGPHGRSHSAGPHDPHPSNGETDAAILDDLQVRLDRAARITLRSDVPVGIFLSGGVDSSVVAHSAARSGRLDTAFCVDMAAQGFSEWTGASAVARRLDLDLVRVPLDVSVLGEFLDVAQHLDDPLADSSAMAVWTVARAAGRPLKVVLSGDGGDELFGGYLTYPASAWHRRIRPMLPMAVWKAVAHLGIRLGVNDRVKVGRGYKLQRFMRALPLETREAHFTWNGTWLPEQAAALASDSRLREAATHALRRLADASGLGASVSLHDLQVSDIREYLANDILVKVDRATMAHGLESRAPLLNPGVAAAALSLPARLRVGANGTTKIALRELCARHFGREHAYAPKQGFSIPVHTWLRHEGRLLMTGLLDRERVDAIGLLDSSAVTHAMQQHLSGTRSYGWELWGLMVLVAWYDQRVSCPPDVRRLADPGDLQQVVPATVLSADGRG